MSNAEVDFKAAVTILIICVIGLTIMCVAVFKTRDWMLFGLGAAVLWFGINAGRD